MKKILTNLGGGRTGEKKKKKERGESLVKKEEK